MLGRFLFCSGRFRGSVPNGIAIGAIFSLVAILLTSGCQYRIGASHGPVPGFEHMDWDPNKFLSNARGVVSRSQRISVQSRVERMPTLDHQLCGFIDVRGEPGSRASFAGNHSFVPNIVREIEIMLMGAGYNEVLPRIRPGFKQWTRNRPGLTIAKTTGQ